jgi:hypothetical protein
MSGALLGQRVVLQASCSHDPCPRSRPALIHAPVRHRARCTVGVCSAVVTDNAVPEGHKGLHGFLYGERGADVHDDAEQRYTLKEARASVWQCCLPLPGVLQLLLQRH